MKIEDALNLNFIIAVVITMSLYNQVPLWLFITITLIIQLITKYTFIKFISNK